MVGKTGSVASCAFAGLWFAIMGCGSEAPTPTGTGDGFSTNPSFTTQSNNCATPEEGCPCSEEGVVLDCGNITRTVGTYVYCFPAQRTCESGQWSPCEGDEFAATSTLQKPTELPGARAYVEWFS